MIACLANVAHTNTLLLLALGTYSIIGNTPLSPHGHRHNATADEARRLAPQRLEVIHHRGSIHAGLKQSYGIP